MANPNCFRCPDIIRRRSDELVPYGSWPGGLFQRKVDNPKKKKIKHLVAKPEILEEIREKIFAKKRIFDSEVRNKLDAIGYQEALLPRKEG